MENFIQKQAGKMKLGIAFKLGILLAAFGVLATGLTGYYTYHATREILVKKASEDLVHSTKIMGRRFSVSVDDIAKDALFLAGTPSSADVIGTGHAVQLARQNMAGQFRSLLTENPEYFQIRFISAQNNGIELVRVDRDGSRFKIVSGLDLQEKLQYPYVYETLRLNAGKVHYSSIFINREAGAHAGHKKPTLQVATPVAGADGKAIGVIVINVDLNQIFAQLKADLRSEYQLYLTNQAGDFLIHPDSAKTFGFDYGRRFLVQDTFAPVSVILNKTDETIAVRTVSANQTSEIVGGFARIPFGDISRQNFVIIGMTVPLNIVLAEAGTLARNSSRIVIGFSILAIILSVLVAFIFVRPLKRLVLAVQRFSEKRELTTLPSSNDELGLLAGSVGQMQQHILAQLNDLNEQNKILQQEISERERMERYEQFRSHALEMLAGDNEISSILEAIVRGVEGLNPEMLCSILLLDKEGKHLGKAVAPSLPDFYNAALEGVEIGVGVGSCGTAAFTGERVIVEDIKTHPYWAPYKALAESAGLGACWSQPICAPSGKVLGTFAIYHHEAHAPSNSDIYLIEQAAHLASITIERKTAENEIQRLAFYDHLTRLPNRRLLLDRLRHALASNARNGKKGALLFIDLDNFKTLNDTLGHDIGDLLLQQVAARLIACVREDDTIARLGGDEFVVMLEDLSEKNIEAAAQTEAIGEKILIALNEPYRLDIHMYRNTPSIGATLFNDRHQSIDELMKQADIAMYQAKKAGRNTLRFFDTQMQDAIHVRAVLEGELRKALENRQFQLYYQIQVDNCRHPLGAEVLIRWIHPERGVIPPAEFIPLAEETGLILPIGKWVMETACAQIREWQQSASDLVLAVNVSAKQFRQADFASQVRAIVQRYAIDPKLLKLELTESLLLDNVDDTVAIMCELNEIGVQLSLDDFGTGYSSMQYLKRLPLDQIKIDQSFVREIAEDASDKAIVRAIIAMAQSLNLDVIAEGVETEEQRQILLDNGCMHFQGYLFGRPVAIEIFETLLKAG